MTFIIRTIIVLVEDNFYSDNFFVIFHISLYNINIITAVQFCMAQFCTDMRSITKKINIFSEDFYQKYVGRGWYNRGSV